MDISDCWQKTVNEIFGISASFGALLKSARLVEFNEGNLKLEVNYKFHKEKIEEMKNKTILENIAEKFFQNKIKLECLVAEVPVVSSLEPKQEKTLSGVAEEMFG